MADTVTPQRRSEIMGRIQGVDTGPEMVVQKLVHAMGYRFRLHAKDLPGRPDLVFPRLHRVIFVHGCFWHRHRKKTCRLARLPKSRVDYWEPKLEANRLRDLRNKRLLRKAGWRVLEIWECDLQKLEALTTRIRYFLENEVS